MQILLINMKKKKLFCFFLSRISQDSVHENFGLYSTSAAVDRMGMTRLPELPETY